MAIRGIHDLSTLSEHIHIPKAKPFPNSLSVPMTLNNFLQIIITDICCIGAALHCPLGTPHIHPSGLHRRGLTQIQLLGISDTLSNISQRHSFSVNLVCSNSHPAKPKTNHNLFFRCGGHCHKLSFCCPPRWAPWSPMSLPLHLILHGGEERQFLDLQCLLRSLRSREELLLQCSHLLSLSAKSRSLLLGKQKVPPALVLLPLGLSSMARRH